MKLVLSRKGFDAGYGKVPSPIFADGSLCSLPIPSDDDPRLGGLTFRGESLGRVVSDLTKERIGPMQGIHLDPDLRRELMPRPRGWRPIFGQSSAAQTHLENQGVGVGDLFLFFGWFRQATQFNGRFIYDERSPQLHVIFGWLQVGRVLKPARQGGSVPAWAADHPHVAGAERRASNNALYVARHRLWLPGLKKTRPGAGVFPRLSPLLRLSAGGRNRGIWRLPRWFFPREGRPPLSYHADPARWARDTSGVLLKTVGRGQEFVLDCDSYPEAGAWLIDIFTHAT